jgi:hypothetical protein
VHQFNRPDVTLQGPDTPKPYNGNYVQAKCNRLDARATPSRRGLVMGAFSTILERQLQLTVRTLGQVVRTLSGILIITFYSNIGLGQNWRRWKADKKYCQLTIWTATISIRTEPTRKALQKIPELLSGQEKLDPSGRPKAPVRTPVFQTPFWTRFWVS